MSTYDALYLHVHAHARWSFSLRLGSLLLQDGAAYPHHDAAGVKGLALLWRRPKCGLCTSCVLTAAYLQPLRK
jgi:hypothetical protein